MENINKNKLSIKYLLCEKNNLISVETTNDYYIKNNILKKKELNTIIETIYNYYKKYDIKYILKSNITENDILKNDSKIIICNEISNINYELDSNLNTLIFVLDKKTKEKNRTKKINIISI